MTPGFPKGEPPTATPAVFPETVPDCVRKAMRPPPSPSASTAGTPLRVMLGAWIKIPPPDPPPVLIAAPPPPRPPWASCAAALVPTLRLAWDGIIGRDHAPVVWRHPGGSAGSGDWSLFSRPSETLPRRREPGLFRLQQRPPEQGHPRKPPRFGYGQAVYSCVGRGECYVFIPCHSSQRAVPIFSGRHQLRRTGQWLRPCIRN